VQGLKQERILNQGGSVLTIVEHSFQVRGVELCAFLFGLYSCILFSIGILCVVVFGIKYTAIENLEENVGAKSFGYEISNVMRVSGTVVESWLFYAFWEFKLV